MNIFEQYGIKEVADVCLYAIELDENDDEVYVPVLYLDTLKVSTVEQTAEQTSARGGVGNPELIIWDYGKEITVTLEDALYSPASMGMTWGGKHGTKKLELYGDLEIINSTEEIGSGEVSESTFNEKIEKQAKIIIDNYNNYEKVQIEYSNDIDWGEDKLTRVDAYVWTSNIALISIDGTQRYYYKKAIIGYDIKNNRYILLKEVKSTLDSPLSYKYIADREIEFENSELNNHKYRRIRFSINDSYNTYTPAPQEVIYQIDHALNNIKYLERIEKCKATQTFVIDTDINLKHGNYRYLQKYSEKELTVFIDPRIMQPYEPNTDEFVRKNGETINGNLRVIKQHEIYYKWTRTKAIDYTTLGHQIIVDPIHFPGCYRLVGETYSRSRKTGKDQRFQFEIPLCKMGSENNFTLEAEGDPTTFNMTLKVLRREDGVMMKLTQYDVEPAKYDNYTSGSTNIVPTDEIDPENPLPDPIDEQTIEWRFERNENVTIGTSNLSLDINQNNFIITNTLSNSEEDVDGYLVAKQEIEQEVYKIERKYINGKPTNETRRTYIETIKIIQALEPEEYNLEMETTNEEVK